MQCKQTDKSKIVQTVQAINEGGREDKDNYIYIQQQNNKKKANK